MKLPVEPPDLRSLIRTIVSDPELASAAFGGRFGPVPGGKYRPWDKFRHLEPPVGMTVEVMWAMVKLARSQLMTSTPLRDVQGIEFKYGLPPTALDFLHRVDRDASGIIGAPEQVTNPHTQATYLLKSLVEEAITSSQLEGASTARRVAKDMLLSGREPQDRSERMIVNNYHALRYVRENRLEPITPSHIFELQTLLVRGTLHDANAAGRFRRDDESIAAEDEAGNILHRPPSESELPSRLDNLCSFANGSGTQEFLHPVVRAILVHFGLAYDHPFVDGNGRTARALFYWVMAREGYWLCEYVSISRILKKARARYARSFLYTETDDNDATYFVLYQLHVLTRAIADLHAYLERKAAEMREVDDLVRHSRRLRAELNSRQLDLLTHALKHSQAEYTIKSHRRAHAISYATARSDLLELSEKGLIQRRKRGRNFIFIAPLDLKSKLKPPSGHVGTSRRASTKRRERDE